MAKKYPDGKLIPKELPAAYKLGNKLKNCSNCLFYLQKYCSLWGANVRGEYLCAKWKSKSGGESGGSGATYSPQPAMPVPSGSGY